MRSERATATITITWLIRFWSAQRLLERPFMFCLAGCWLATTLFASHPEAAQPAVRSANSVPTIHTDSTGKDHGASKQQEPADMGNAARLPVRPFETPRQLLHLFGISDSLVDSFTDGQSLVPGDEEALIRILHRIPQIGWDEIDRWQRSDVPWASLAERPRQMRTAFFRIHGRVRHVERQDLSPRLAALFDFTHFYRVRMDVPDRPFRLTVCTRVVPDAWRKRADLNERAAVSGMFLKRGVKENERTELLFAARRVAWFPDHVEPEAGIRPAHVFLGHLGMDVGLFDLVRKRNRLPIDASERECFYQLLANVGRLQSAPKQSLIRSLDLRALLQHPQTQTGRLYRVEGTICRITKVLVEELDIRRRFGIDHYYQLDMLVPLGDAEIIIHGPDGKSDGPIYRNTFPFTLCVTRLPKAWRQLVDRDQIRQSASMLGFFYKIWAYPSSYVSRYNKGQRQWSPMFIAVEPQPQATPTSSSSWGIFIGIGFLAMLAILWIIVWRVHRSDQKFARQLRQKQTGRPENISLDPADLEQ